MATSDPGRAFESDRRLLQTLERVLTIDELDLHGALSTACTLVADALAADKADVFIYEAKGGVAVAVFRKGERYHAGEVDKDPEQLRGMVEALAVRSEIAVQLT